MIHKKLASRPALIIMVALTAIAVSAIVLLLTQRAPDNGLEMEQNATVGILPGIDLDARRRELQTQVDESRIAFSVNAHPVFKTGAAKGNLLLENPANNAKLFTAELVLDSTGEILYQSKAISPGTYISDIPLKKALAKGQYPATVYIKAYSEDTQKFIGQTGAAVTLTVLA